MLSRAISLRLYAMVGLLALVGPASAQTLNDGMDALNKKRNESRTTIGALFSGAAAFDAKEPLHVEAVDVAAKLITYPYVLDVIDKQAGKMSDVYVYFVTDLKNVLRFKEKSPDLPKAYSDAVKTHALEVINLPSAKPIARVNAARTLARLTELGQVNLADALVEVLRTPLKQEQGRDGLRYWALRGLRDLLALPPQSPPLLDKATEEKVALTLLDFLAQPPAVTAASPAAEIEGFRMLRREAVRALAQIRLPVIKDKGRPALVLAMFAGNDERIQPPPRLDERLEAALGLAHMRASKEVPDYQADYAAQQIGLFLSHFGNTANSNHEIRAAYERLRPWSIDAARLSEALATMKAEVKDKYVASVAQYGERVLAPIIKNQVAQAGDLSWFANPDNQAPNQTLFKDKPDTAVRPAPPEAPKAPPEK